MGLPVLSETGHKRVEAARLEADTILAESQATAERLVAKAHQMGIDPTGVGFSPGDGMLNLAREEIIAGRSGAAAHLFGALLAELLHQGVDDMTAFSQDLDKTSNEVGRAYSVDPEILADFKRQAHVMGLRQYTGESNGVRRQLATESASSVTASADDFPPGSLVHRLIEETSLLVKERAAVFASEHIGKLPKEDASASEFIDFQATAIVGAYDVWLGVLFDQADLTDDAAKAFEELSNELERALMDNATKHALRFISRQALLTELRPRMLQKKHHWIGTMLKKVRERKEVIRAAGVVDPLVDSQPPGGEKTRAAQANPPTEQAGPEPESPSMPPAASGPSAGDDERATLVDDFLDRCNQEPNRPRKITKTHIWKFVGHSQPRQFQYWQAGHKCIRGGTRGFTDEDERNFRRVLTMEPAVFIEQLEKKLPVAVKR